MVVLTIFDRTGAGSRGNPGRECTGVKAWREYLVGCRNKFGMTWGRETQSRDAKQRREAETRSRDAKQRREAETRSIASLREDDLFAGKFYLSCIEQKPDRIYLFFFGADIGGGDQRSEIES